jgi:F0F1-type ATP synthase membrane subunit b/b'
LAGWIGLSSDATFHLCSALNFIVMVAFICWKGYPRLTAVLRARSSLIRRTIDEAQLLSEEAQRRLAEIESRWAQLDSEIAAMQVVAEAGMEDEEQALLEATAEDTRRILEYSEHEIGATAQRARHELKAFAADLAVSIARQSILIDERTDQDLIRAFVKELEHSDEFAQTTLEVVGRAFCIDNFRIRASFFMIQLPKCDISYWIFVLHNGNSGCTHEKDGESAQ